MRGGPQWYAVAAKHRQAHAAYLAIGDLGFRAFLPWVSCPLPNGARELRPMFGPYVFAYFDAQKDPWGGITRLACVVDRPVLGPPGSPTPIPAALVDRIYADLGRRYEDVVASAKRGVRLVVDNPVGVVVQVGAEVRLTKGWHEGSCGVVDAVKQGGRLARVALGGVAIPLWVPADRLELLEDAKAA